MLYDFLIPSQTLILSKRDLLVQMPPSQVLPRPFFLPQYAHHLQTLSSYWMIMPSTQMEQLFTKWLIRSVLTMLDKIVESALQVIWSFLVEDSNLFLKYFMEKLTRDNQEEMFQIIRSLIRFIPQLPHQAAFSLYNYLIGYIMFYFRSPRDRGEEMIGSALSLIWMVIHSVQGIGLKDLKQILRKEQVAFA